MVDTVTSRPSHYELLGLSPAASADEISRAFVRAMAQPRAFGSIAELGVAYETLRNPARRRTYDAAIGVNAPPQPQQARPPAAWRAQAQFIAAPAATARPAEPLVDAPVDTGPALPPFLATALRELAEPAPLKSQARDAVRAPSGAGPRVAPFSAPPAMVAAPLDQADEADDEEGAAPWKRIAVPAAGLVAVVGLIGAWAGWQSQASPVAPRAEAALLAPPTTFAVGDPAQAAADPVLDKGKPAAVATRSPHRVRRAERAQPASRLAGIDRQLAPQPEVAAAETAAEPAPAYPVAEAAPAKAVAASMPLPNSVIARTIGRIGYPCGSVASTSQILGKTFTVTCTSGHTYRAAPVGGRYHFRRVR
jgi:hypothetical protein